MTELLTLILSDFKHFIGTMILMGWAGTVIMFIVGAIIILSGPKRGQ